MKANADVLSIDWRKLMPVLIIAVGVLAYANSFSGVFIFDDAYTIRAGYRLWRSWLFGGGVFFSRRPVTDVTFALNYAVGRLKAADYHAVNLVIHLLASLLLYGVVRRTLELISHPTVSRVATSIENSMLAFASAAIWVCHPLTTGAVTYISQRYESLMSMFYLLTLYCVIRGVGSSRKRLWYAVAVSSCVLGMGSKEVMVTAPVAVLVYDWMFLSGSFRELAKKRWGLYVGLAGTWLILVLLMNVKLPLDGTAYCAWKGIPPLSYAATQFGVICRYLRLALWPVGLCFDYGWWPVAADPGKILLTAIPVAVLATATLIAVYRRSGWGFPGAWFFLVLAPTSSFIPRPDSIVEHRMYLPLAGVTVLTVVGFDRALRSMGSRLAWSDRLRRTVLVVTIALALATLTGMTAARNRIYQSEESVWRDVIARRPDNLRAHLGLGTALLAKGKHDEAEACFESILGRCSTASGSASHYIIEIYAIAHHNLGVIRFREGEYEQAESRFREALRVAPNFKEARENLGHALRRQPSQK